MAVDVVRRDSALIKSQRSIFAETIFFSFLVLALVGLEPFAVRDLQFIRSIHSGEGSISRQVAYLAAFSCTIAASLQQRRSPFAAMPISVVVILCWCMVSISWAIEPSISLRRFALTFAVVLTAMCGVQNVGVERALAILRTVLAGILIVNWISIAIVPHAVHLPGEYDPALVGNWRGLFYHKNIAGPITALSAFVFLYFARTKKRKSDWLLFCAAIVFTVMTRSKTSMGFFVCCLLFSLIYEVALKRDVIRKTIVPVTALLLGLGLPLAFVSADTFMAVYDEPAGFTGRIDIWRFLFEAIREEPLLGYGFGGFWEIGINGPTVRWGGYWVMYASHSHNGYLETLVTTGAIGLTLAIFGFVILPIKYLLYSNASHSELKCLLFASILFVALHDLLETSFLSRDRGIWVLFLIFLSIFQELRREMLTPQIQERQEHSYGNARPSVLRNSSRLQPRSHPGPST